MLKLRFSVLLGDADTLGLLWSGGAVAIETIEWSSLSLQGSILT